MYLIASLVLEANNSSWTHNMKKHVSLAIRLVFMGALLMEELASRYAGMARITASSGAKTAIYLTMMVAARLVKWRLAGPAVEAPLHHLARALQKRQRWNKWMWLKTTTS
jgi:hypothetical protein